jgi:hypothetical protein
MNEPTFVSRLGAVTRLRAESRRAAGLPVLIASGEVEERQLDPRTGRYRRCDIRLNSNTGRKLVSGEVKRPEHPEGRDPRNESLRADARNKAVARGLPYYFTCNMADVLLFSVANRPGEEDREEGQYTLAPITHSRSVTAHIVSIEEQWTAFLDDLERRLEVVESARPSVTTADVLLLRDAIEAITKEAIHRVVARVSKDERLAINIREEALSAFGFSAALHPSHPETLREELLQILRLGTFVVVQKLLLYRVLSEVGPKRVAPFRLDELVNVRGSTDPDFLRRVFQEATAHAITRSRDYETAFLPKPVEHLVFLPPATPEEIRECRVGEVWQRLLDNVNAVSWSAISQNLTGFLYEAIVEPEFRHQLGQYYTPEDVVDFLITFAVRQPGDLMLDPACGGGSFLRAAYARKRALGDTHEQALAELWGLEITAFAAELSTVTLATADTHEPAAYPRVLLRDFFQVQPGALTELHIPGHVEPLSVPMQFDAVAGNPPYISYRRQINQLTVLRALERLQSDLKLPVFSGKSDEYVWFLVHATRFLRADGRLAFVVSAALLFSDYGIPLIRFLARYYRIRAVIDSAVERWFLDADTNTILLLLEREDNLQIRQDTEMRFVRLRRPFAQLLPLVGHGRRRDALEDLVEEILTAAAGSDDPRFLVNVVRQGEHGGLVFASGSDDADEETEAQKSHALA